MRCGLGCHLRRAGRMRVGHRRAERGLLAFGCADGLCRGRISRLAMIATAR